MLGSGLKLTVKDIFDTLGLSLGQGQALPAVSILVMLECGEQSHVPFDATLELSHSLSGSCRSDNIGVCSDACLGCEEGRANTVRIIGIGGDGTPLVLIKTCVLIKGVQVNEEGLESSLSNQWWWCQWAHQSLQSH